jgi:uncharacterized membrane protein HdeD (DUF308 family)
MASSAGLLSGFGNDARNLCRRTWWVFLVGGLASVAFGVLAFLQPGIALFVLAMFFAAYVLVDGALNAIGAVQNRDKDGWWIMLLIGLLGLVVGAFALVNPPVSILAFLFLVALEAILLGVLLLVLGYKVRQATDKEWILYVTGALSILFGVLVIARPATGSLTVVYMIAAWSLVTGILKILFAFRVRSLPDRAAKRLSGFG